MDKQNIGIEALPKSIRESTILSVENIIQLGSVQQIPKIDPAFVDDTLKNIVQYYAINPNEMEAELHHYAKQLLDSNNVEKAWQILLSGEFF